VSDTDRRVMATGIAAGAVWFSLRDLTEKVERLPAGELRDRWSEATKAMNKALNGAMDTHRDLAGDGATS
jgi:hypothetical protein